MGRRRPQGASSLLGLEKWLRRYDLEDGEMDHAVSIEQLRKGLRQCGILSLGDQHFDVLLRAFEHPADPRPVVAYLQFIDAVRGALPLKRDRLFRTLWAQVAAAAHRRPPQPPQQQPQQPPPPPLTATTTTTSAQRLLPPLLRPLFALLWRPCSTSVSLPPRRRWRRRRQLVHHFALSTFAVVSEEQQDDEELSVAELKQVFDPNPTGAR